MKKFKNIFVVFLCFVMIMLQCAPLQVFAEEVKSKSKTLPTTEQEKDIHILDEVKDKRTEYTKTFILSDGSYCDVYSFVKLHEEVDGKMENIYSDLNQSFSKIEDVQSAVSNIENTQYATKRIEKNNSTGTRSVGCPLLTTLYGNSTSNPCDLLFYQGNDKVSYSNNQFNINGKGVFVMVFDNLSKYTSRNRSITNASLSFTATYTATLNTQLSLYYGNSYWQNNYPISAVDITGLTAVDVATLSKHVEGNNTVPFNVSFNLLNVLTNYDRGTIDCSEGLYVSSSTTKSFTLSNPVVTISYREYGYDDINCTYHKIELGDKADILVNDYTNTITLKQNLLGIDVSSMPVNLVRLSTSADVELPNKIDLFSTVNYCSSIILYGNTLEWKMFDGSKKLFTRPCNPELVNNMEIWEEKEETQSSQNPALLYIDNTAISNNEYQNCYIDYGLSRYTFDALGRNTGIASANNNISITYSGNKMSMITDGVGNKYVFNYTNENATYPYGISAYDSNDNAISLNSSNNAYAVGFSRRAYNNTYTVTTTYADNKAVLINYDNSGKIIGASYEGRTVVFTYAPGQNYITEYEVTDTDADTLETTTYKVSIDCSNILRRAFIFYHEENNVRIDDKCDIIDYNFDGQITSSQTLTPNDNSNMVCYQYDSYGNIASYALEENTSQIIIDGDMIIGDDWEWESSGISFNGDELVLDSVPTSTSTVFQEGIHISANKTYVLSASIKCDDIKNDYRSYFDIVVEDEDGEEITTLPLLIGNGLSFDNNRVTNSNYETKRILFSIDYNTDAVVYINSAYQAYSVSVDYVYINEASSSGYCNSVINNENTTYNNDGKLLSDNVVRNSEKLTTSFTYDENGNVASLTNQNGVTEHYKYDNNGLLSQKGFKIQNNTIVDPITYAYDSVGILESVSQTLSMLNSPNTTQTSYSYYLGQVSSVTLNDISYNFEYSPTGEIKRIVRNDADNTRIELLEKSSSNDVTTIEYANNSKVECSYSNGNIATISYYVLVNNSYIPKITYSYTYDTNSNELKKIFDNEHLITEFLSNGYQVLYTIDGNIEHGINIYKKTTDNILNYVTETYFEDIFTSGNTPTERCVTTPIVVSQNNNGTTKSQIINSSKIYSSAATNHPSLLYSASLNESSDLFERITSKSASLNFTVSGSQSYSSSIQESISYKQLSSGDQNQNELPTTSNLVSQHNYSYSFNSNQNNPTSHAYSYDYYENGKLKLVSDYIDEVSAVMPICYYEYDNAGRIVLEYKLVPNVCTAYQYDNYGNLTQRIFYDINTSDSSFEEIFFKFLHKRIGYEFDSQFSTLNDNTFNDSTVFTHVGNQFVYSFDSNNKELISGIQINETTYNDNQPVITSENYTVYLDELGQPTKNYFYSIYQDGIDSVDCEWTGNLLTKCENDDYRIEYTYDVNGYLASKKVYNERNGDYEYAGTIFYNWDDGILQGLSFLSTNENQLNEGLYTDILYDISGEPIGIQVPSGIQYYFSKDCNGNVLGLLGPDGNATVELYYDAFGMLGLKVNGANWIEAIINAVTGVCNPVSFGKMIYDYQTGIYFDQGRCYSAFYGRYMNITNYNALNKISQDPNTNPYIFAGDDPINNSKAISDTDANGNRTFVLSSGIDTDMTTAFLSRTYCDIYTKMLLKQYGVADGTGVLRLKGLTKEEIESSLFAHTVGRYCDDVLNRINSVWCDEWLYANRNSNVIHIDKYDTHYEQYLAIWNNAELIKEYSFNKGIFIGV